MFSFQPNDQLAGEVGQKAKGLFTIPSAWRPPLGLLPLSFYGQWTTLQPIEANGYIARAAAEIAECTRRWAESWPRGIILRSSASSETMEDRGSLKSCRLAGDYTEEQISNAMISIFEDFRSRRPTDNIAIVVQPLIGEGALGPLSNERRVSKTINQWRLEITYPDYDFDGLNSQRDEAPPVDKPLKPAAFDRRNRNRLFGSVGRWANSLEKGPAHFEWAYDGEAVWLLQLDFEAETPDEGIDPRQQLRLADYKPSIIPAESNAFRVEYLNNDQTWRKIENTRVFREVRRDPYPTLISITGKALEENIQNADALRACLDNFANGRIVCRTDCSTSGFPRENLPRTNTINSREAILTMLRFLKDLVNRGAKPAEINFILHKFIPARAGAWVKADPSSQIVEINSLWGLPDGLQYMPYDTYEYDVRRKAVTAERIRYKPKFIQENEDGQWIKLDVKRSLARSKSLNVQEVIEVGEQSYEIVCRLGKAALIMWFCGIPKEIGIGANLPWFRMPPGEVKLSTAVAPRWPRHVLRTVDDIEEAEKINISRTILLLDPDVELIRDDTKFLQRVAKLANEKNLPVEIAGSTLAHAFYLLDKAGVAVFPKDESQRTRTRNRRSFDKLVRDNIPEEIQEHGEVVIQSRLHKTELRFALVAKMLEEAEEFVAAVDPDDVKGELADLLEIVRSMAIVTGVEWSQVVEAADDKRQRRGGFGAGAVLVETAWPSARRTSTAAPALMTLRHLGQISDEGGNKIISFNALLADRQRGVEVDLGGEKIFVQLTSKGLKVAYATEETSEVQLSLFENEP